MKKLKVVAIPVLNDMPPVGDLCHDDDCRCNIHCLES